MFPMNFRVGSWQVRPDRNVLSCDARSIHVSPKAMEVLRYLAGHHGQVIGKEELIHALWNDVFVTDDALTRCIGELRRAVKDDAREPSFIQNIPKRGYVLLPEVIWEEVQDGTAPELRKSSRHLEINKEGKNLRGRLWRVGGFMVVVLAVVALAAFYVITRSRSGVSPPMKHRLAVIPLTNVSSDPQQDYFADGMTEQLITELAQISAWDVISRTSVTSYKGSRKSLPQIGRELNADWLVEGTVQRAGNRVRITAQLINAASDTHIWSESFDRDMSDILVVQSEIARKIADEMDLTLARQDEAHLMAARRVDPEAFDAYLSGKYFLNRHEHSKAAEYFEKATLEDPNFALAHALLWEADSMISFERDLPWSERALKAAHRALELDGTLSEAHSAVGDIKFYGDWDWSGGEAEFRRAVELNPNSSVSSIHYAVCLHAEGRFDAAISEIQRTLRFDPASLAVNQSYLGILIDSHRYAEALGQAQKTIELDPNNARTYLFLAAAYQSVGKNNDALAAYLKADTLNGVSGEDLRAMQSAADAGGLRGYFVEQLIYLKRKARTERVPPMRFATLYAQLGESDDAMRMLESAYREHSHQLVWIRAVAAWDPMRNDLRFQSLLRRMRLSN